MTKGMNWRGNERAWIYVRLAHDATSWRLAGEKLATGTIAWVDGADAIRRLFELGLDPACAERTSGHERRSLIVMFALAERGEWRILGAQRAAKLRRET